MLTQQAYIALTWQAHYWRAQYEQLVEREAAFKAQIEAHQAPPVVDDVRDLRTAEPCCPVCGEAFRAFPGPEESTRVEMQVQAYVWSIQQSPCGKFPQAKELPMVANTS